MAKRKSSARPEKAKVGHIYLIRHIGTDAHKIGITLDWYRRAEQLEVGLKTEEVAVARVLWPGRLEKQLHHRYGKHRLPQSEWFHLSAEQVMEVVNVFATESVKYKVSIEGPKAEHAPRTPKPYRLTGGESIHVAPEPGWSRNAAGSSTSTQVRPAQEACRDTRSEQKVRSTSTAQARKSVGVSWSDCIFMGFASTFMPIWLILAGLAGGSGESVGFFLVLQVLVVSLWMRAHSL